MRVIQLFQTVKNYTLIKQSPEQLRIKYLKKAQTCKIVRGEFGRYIENFIETLVLKGGNFDFTYFFKNLKTLQVIVVPKLDGDTIGEYNIKENVIYIDSRYIDRIEDIIYHELFHMLSSTRKKDRCYSGLNNEGLFVSFNEGYTEVLTKRYFGDRSKMKAYTLERDFAELIEIVAGQAEMENLYSKIDYRGLLERLSMYGDMSELYIKIGGMNTVRKNCTSSNMDKCILLYKKSLLMVIEMFIKKCKNSSSSEEIIRFFQTMPVAFFWGSKRKYTLFTNEEFQEFVDRSRAALHKHTLIYSMN